MSQAQEEYVYSDADPTCAHACLWPALNRIIASHSFSARRIFDLGCGSGATAKMLSEKGFDVVGVDPSASGIAAGRAAYPRLALYEGDSEQDLAARFGRFPLVISLEVVEHCFRPRTFANCIYDLLEPGGIAVVSTPYHGYLKNLALAATNKMDSHFTALWDYGHIKFWSMGTLSQLLREARLEDIEFVRMGRIPALAKGMIAVARRKS